MYERNSTTTTARVSESEAFDEGRCARGKGVPNQTGGGRRGGGKTKGKGEREEKREERREEGPGQQ